jgi:hypothetical protein
LLSEVIVADASSKCDRVGRKYILVNQIHKLEQNYRDKWHAYSSTPSSILCSTSSNICYFVVFDHFLVAVRTTVKSTTFSPRTGERTSENV